jgi:hypothetical protein
VTRIGLTRDQLERLAALYNVRVTSSDTDDKIQRRILQRIREIEATLAKEMARERHKKMIDTIELKRGFYLRDHSGLWHYLPSKFGLLRDALADALSPERPTPAWFWWEATPAPIFDGDDAASLHARWEAWRAAYQTSRQTLMDVLEALTRGQMPVTAEGKPS